MPFAEIANALFVTFLATEYHQANSYSKTVQMVALAILVIINVLDRVAGAATTLHQLFHRLFHIPKIALAILLYTTTLYLDCRRIRYHKMTISYFARHVGVAMIQVAPWYPFLAVLISFGFLFIISLWEAVHLPLSWLNWPIYYGTLYGPFSMVYFQVKRKIRQEALLPV